MSWLQSPSTVIWEKTRKENLSLLPLSPHLFVMKWWDQMPRSLFYERWVWSQLFHSLSPSRDSIVPLHFLPKGWCHLHIWGYWYFSQQSWFQFVLLDSSSCIPAFLMMYSAYKLNKQGDNIQPWHTFPSLEPVCCSMSSSNCCFLTCMQISQEASQVVWYSHLFKNFSQFVVIKCIVLKRKNNTLTYSFFNQSYLDQKLYPTYL